MTLHPTLPDNRLHPLSDISISAGPRGTSFPGGQGARPPPADEWQPGFLFRVSRLNVPADLDRFTNGVRPPPGPSLGHAAREFKEATSDSCVHSMQWCQMLLL
jgi:hypothetical protein